MSIDGEDAETRYAAWQIRMGFTPIYHSCGKNLMGYRLDGDDCPVHYKKTIKCLKCGKRVMIQKLIEKAFIESQSSKNSL